ncbi:sulfite exporter TauE/SafE family protein [Paenibacillus flagellatus]|uniref:Probable membrane transporter protein n=1 Tax=Paenibacillus flagellatus TaxID=2211139 RepID=A0A2V5KBJ4_9BACL|nr:sulfite exporter TauE/SafE family protein [Paenibacillus flagellatus]PYI55494.1 hypothetical protein DLM86_07100 [Paenibacillus flagellatus]
MEWIWTFLIVVMSAAVQTGTGFGFAIMAIPLLLLVNPDHSAVSTALALSLLSSLSTLPKVVRDADRRMLGRLLTGSAFGLPLGGLVFFLLDVEGLKAAAGVAILAFAVPLLIRMRLPLGGGRGAGLLSGFLGASVGMPGPPVVLYMLSADVGKNVFRGTSIAYYSAVNAVSLTIQLSSGRVVPAELVQAAFLVPAIFAGQYIGAAAARRLSPVWFRRATMLLLVASGVQALLTGL